MHSDENRDPDWTRTLSIDDVLVQKGLGGDVKKVQARGGKATRSLLDADGEVRWSERRAELKWRAGTSWMEGICGLGRGTDQLSRSLLPVVSVADSSES